MQQYLSLSELNSLVILAGSSSWLANMPNASINICDYKLQIWSKYLNTSSVGYIGLQQHGFNTSKGLGTQHSRSRSHSPNHVSRSRWILIPNGTFGLTGLAWHQLPAMLIANLIEVCTLLWMYCTMLAHKLTFFHPQFQPEKPQAAMPNNLRSNVMTFVSASA